MRYIIEISNVSSQGEQCMMIPMVGLVILVMFISDSASDVKKIGTSGTNSGGDEVVEIFSVSLSIRGFCEQKLCIHASSFGDRSVCFFVKENSESAQEQEYWFRGSTSLSIALLALYLIIP